MLDSDKILFRRSPTAESEARNWTLVWVDVQLRPILCITGSAQYQETKYLSFQIGSHSLLQQLRNGLF